MKFYFDTINGFGKLTHEDFIHNPIDFYPEDLEEALKNGLLPDEANVITPMPWFASRSTRIKVDDFKPTETSRKLSKKITAEVMSYTNETCILEKIFEEYCRVKNFHTAFNLSALLTNNAKEKNIILYYYQGNPIGFVVMRFIGHSALSLQFAWDYEKPKLSLGKVSQYFEIELCKQQKVDYLYLMPAYESSCLYKADFSAIEWYTGKKWSTDTNQLKELMFRDEQIKIIK